MKKFIFDIDSTIFNTQFVQTDQYFRSVLSKEDSDKMISQMYLMISKYEKIFSRYDIDDLSKFFTRESSISISTDMIKGWIDAKCHLHSEVNLDAVEILEYLKQKGYSIVILSNQMSVIQKSRLEHANLLEFFDEIYGGEIYLKPSRESYFYACGNTSHQLCTMIGDHYQNDYLQPKRYGLNSILYDPEDKNKQVKSRVKELSMIKELY